MHNWAVSNTNEAYLDEIKTTHTVEQLPAYDINGNLIAPLDYEEKLAGSIARICFSVAHFHIKQKHIYNAYVKDITVVRPPTSIATTSLKHLLHPKKKQKTN